MQSIIRLGVIGASNSLVRPGYVDECIAQLADAHGVQVTSVTNLAVGASTCFLGLMQVLSTGVARAVDVLLVEYALTDEAAFGARSDLYRAWAQCFEGVLRRALHDNPDLVVCVVLLGRENGAWRRALCPITAGTKYLSEWYGVTCVDVGLELKLKHPQMLVNGTLYADPAHFTSDQGVPILGRLVAEAVVKAVRHPVRAVPPRPVDPGHAGFAKMVTDLDQHVVGISRHVHLTNSLVDVWATELPAGAELRFQLSGAIMAFQYAATRESPLLEITIGPTRRVVPTMPTFMGNTDHPFLIAHVVPELHYGFALAAQDEEVTIRVLGGPARSELDPLATSGYAQPSGAGSPVWLLQGLLVRGQMGSALASANDRPEPRLLSEVAAAVHAERLTYLTPAKLLRLEQCVSTVVSDGVPGAFLEAGVALGGSAVLLAHHAQRHGRRFDGYDVFGQIPPPGPDEPDEVHRRHAQILAGESRGIRGDRYYGYVDDLFDRVTATFERHGVPVGGDVMLHRGLIQETLLVDHPLALVHIDTDWYEPVLVTAERVHPHLSIGGFLISDDYFFWPSAKHAMDEFLLRHPGYEALSDSGHLVLRKVS